MNASEPGYQEHAFVFSCEGENLARRHPRCHRRPCCQLPSVQRVVLWGLCDGASAACLYAPHDERVKGLILVNPRGHTPTGQAVTRLKHYYLKRLMSASFWKVLLCGKLNWRESAREVCELGWRLAPKWTRALTIDPQSSNAQPLPARMAHALRDSGRPFAVLLSDEDQVAREFQDIAWPSADWQRLKRDQLVALEHLAQANHTLSTPSAQTRMHEHMRNWLARLTRVASFVVLGTDTFFSSEPALACLEFAVLRV